jgi:hypothetical protein
MARSRELIVAWSTTPKLRRYSVGSRDPIGEASATDPCDLPLPAQSPRFLYCEVEKIEEAVLAFNVSENVSNIGATREERIHHFNQFAFISKEALVFFSLHSEARCPGLDANNVAARVVVLFEGTGEMDHVAAPDRCGVEFA